VFGYDLKRTMKVIEKIIKTTEMTETIEVRLKPAVAPQHQGWIGIPTFIMHDRSLTPGFKEHLGTLLGCANEERRAWPGRKWIAERTGKSMPTMARYNRILRDKFKVEIFQRGFNRSNLYIFPNWWPLPQKLASKNDARQSPVIAPGNHQRSPDLYSKYQDNNTSEKNKKISYNPQPGGRIERAYKGILRDRLIRFLKNQPQIKDPEGFLAFFEREGGPKFVRRLPKLELGLWKRELEFYKLERSRPGF